MLGERLGAVVLVVALGDRDAPLAIDLLHGTGGMERRPRRPDEIGGESRARTDAPRGLAPIAEIDRYRVVGMAGNYDHRRVDFAVADGDLDDVVFLELELRER